MVNANTQTKRFTILNIIAVACFALTVLGFFLSWGTYSGGNSQDGIIIKFEYTHHGWTAKYYGFVTLALGLIGLILATISLVKRVDTTPGQAPAALIGILILLYMRADSDCFYPSFSYALSHAYLMLGYPTGPFLILISFLVILIITFFQTNQEVQTKEREDRTKESTGP